MKKTATLALVAFGAALGAAGMAVGQAALPAPKGDTERHPIGSVDLKGEFPALEGRILYLGTTVVAPGAGKAVHTHHNTPEIEHIVSGVLTDQRNGGPPTAYGPGSTLINTSGTTHAYVNLGKEPVVFTIASIRPAADK